MGSRRSFAPQRRKTTSCKVTQTNLRVKTLLATSNNAPPFHVDVKLVTGKVATGLVVAALLVVALILIAALRPGGAPRTTSTPTSSYTQTESQPALLKGLTFSLASYDSSGIADFFAKAQQAGSVVEWAGDWEELDGSGAPATVAQLSSQNDLKSMIVVQFFTQSTGQLIRPLNATNEQHYLSITADFVRQYRPSYLGVGIEVNLLYEKNATSFGEFVHLYQQVYAEVKSVSPETVVFTIFQLEKMNGLAGGLYGGVNDPGKAEWPLLAQFPEDDIAAFTTYPSLVYQSPSDMPSDYYTSIASHTNRSVGFTEVGWHSGFVAGGWGSNEAEQADFVMRFFDLTSSLDRTFAVWSFLYDQNVAAPFNTMGLLYVNGTAKQSWEEWLATH